MRRIVYSLACSLDGFIARLDHSIDWLFMDQDYGMNAFFKTIDTVLVGRKTHDFMVSMGQPAFPGMATYVCTRNQNPKQYDNVKYVSGDPVQFTKELKDTSGKNIWLMGGSDLARSFFEAGMIDEVSLAVHPRLLGKGIPLFAQMRTETPLKLLEEKTYPNGLVQLRYERV